MLNFEFLIGFLKKLVVIGIWQKAQGAPVKSIRGE
jgi:hypothetical protein